MCIRDRHYGVPLRMAVIDYILRN
jgi:hypothetical protein